MSLTDILLLFVIMSALALIPSTSVALVVVRSSTAGIMHGVAVTAGIVLGDLLFVLLAILGMTALADVMGGLFLILKYIAGAYLIWFGISLLRGSLISPALAVAHRGPTPRLTASFLSGLFITLGDIKAIFFYASLLPVFMDLTTINAFDIAIIITLTLIAVGGVKLGYAYAARKVITLLDGHIAAGKLAQRAKISAGGLMLGAGSYLIVKA